MPETDIGNTAVSNITYTEYDVLSEETDGATGNGEFRYNIECWEDYLGYYKTIPELQAAIDAEAAWTLGAGFEASPETQMRISLFSGSGKDSFNDILFNMTRTASIAGDAFAEIITDEQNRIMNIKPLDPSSMVIVYDKKGRIKRYEQTTKTAKYNKRFEPEKIFHLSRKRLADEVHGISVIKAVEWIILARNEAMADWKRVLHRNVDPLQIHYLDTDDTEKINTYKNRHQTAKINGEHLYVPKGTAEIEVISSQLNSAASPLAWIQQLNNYFFQAVGVPQIIIGNSQEFTDASAKIAYLAYEQTIKSKQLYIEEQVLEQLNLEIELTFPASLQNDVISSDKKNTPADTGATPNDTTAEMEGRA